MSKKEETIREMPDSSHKDPINMKLDPDLLSKSFRVKTNWHVITGASCSGKTTLIDQLSTKGFQTAAEAGRQYFEKEMAKGRTIEETRKDRASFTRLIYDTMRNQERQLRVDDVIFLDRGLPDALAFFRFAGIDPNEILPDCFQYRYDSVFLLQRLPYQQDGVRAAEDAIAADFELAILRDYSALGYDVVKVPVLPPHERLAFVLEKLSSQGRI
jgi:predicted ATPase